MVLGLQRQFICLSVRIFQKHNIYLQRMFTKLSQNVESRFLQVSFRGEDKPHRYPFMWLRDNCQCAQCFEPTAIQRAFLVSNLKSDITPKVVQVENDNNDIMIKWPDDHISVFNHDWLKDRRFAENPKDKRGWNIYKSMEYWGSELQDKIPIVEYEKLMTDDKTLYDWIVDLEVMGVQLLTGAPKAAGVLPKIGERVAYLRKQHYGEVFTVMSKDNPSNVAYTGGALGLHTDLAYYDYTPGMQMLHCISQAQMGGGENQLVDGFYVAHVMKKEYPEMYKLLTSTPINYIDIGTDVLKDFHRSSLMPTIQEDSDGNVEKISYSNHSRNSYMNLTADEVQKFYDAMVTFERLLTDERNIITHKMNDGEMLCFHNYRVLHGRAAYQLSGSGKRHLEGGYIDWDEMRSMRRVLEKKLGI